MRELFGEVGLLLRDEQEARPEAVDGDGVPTPLAEQPKQAAGNYWRYGKQVCVLLPLLSPA